MRFLLSLVLLPTLACAEKPTLQGVDQAIQTAMAANEISGAVTVVVTREHVRDLEAFGFANRGARTPMQTDSIFWIKSMTKPITAVGLLMLQEDGKVNVTDPVAKYLPEFAPLKTPSGKPANLTIDQLLTHTSGLGEGLGESGSREDPAHTLADLVRQAVASPMQFEPGERWKDTQSGINAVGRIIEVVSGMSYDQFLSRRLFEPLGMKSSSFYPDEKMQPRIVALDGKNKDTGALEPQAPRANVGLRDHPALPSSGLYSTGPDIARFCQMLLNQGTLEGKRYLQPQTVRLLATPRTGDLKTGFTPGFAWGLGCGVVMEPQGVTAALSRGTFGHGGAYGTQMWIDPVRGIAYVLMIQRATWGTPGYRNGDDTKVRADFQAAAADALQTRTITN